MTAHATTQPTVQPTIRVIACSPPGIFALATRKCYHCDATREMVEEYRGLFYGYERHCLTCRRNEEAYDSPESLARWDAVIAASLLPRHLFDAYVTSEEDCYRTECDTVEKEQAADDAHRQARHEIREYRATKRDIREALTAA